MMREKTILNKFLNFQKNNVCGVGQRLHSPGNDYWLIDKYKDKDIDLWLGLM